MALIEHAQSLPDIRLADVALFACLPHMDYHLYVIPGRCCCGELSWEERNRPAGQVMVADAAFFADEDAGDAS